MQKLVKKITISALFGLILVLGFGQSTLAACTGAETGAAKTTCGLEDTNSKSGLPKGGEGLAETWLTTRVGDLIGNVLAFVGVIFMGFIIYAGFLWMTAGGDSSKTTKAISIMTDAVVGLIVIAAAYLLTQYVGNVVLGDLK